MAQGQPQARPGDAPRPGRSAYGSEAHGARRWRTRRSTDERAPEPRSTLSSLRSESGGSAWWNDSAPDHTRRVAKNP